MANLSENIREHLLLEGRLVGDSHSLFNQPIPISTLPPSPQIRNIQCKVPPFNIPPDLYSIRKIQSSFLDQTNLILLSHSKNNINLLTFSTISQFQYHHSIPANLLLNQTNSMPISYSKDISISIFSQYQDLIRHSLSPKSDKFNTKPLLS